MTTSTFVLDEAVQRYGDDLYRLAVLLTPDASHAADALLAAVKRVAATGDGAADARRLLEALLAAVPAARRGPRHLTAWARASAGHADGPLLAAISQLPAPQRLALGLASLRSFEGLFAAAGAADTEGRERAMPASASDAAPVRHAPFSVLSVSSVAASRRDALLALAHAALAPGEELPPLVGEEVPEACRPARAALTLGDTRAHDDPAIRGHLALCAECRAAARTWRVMAMRVEESLRAALRDVQPPPGLAEQLRSALRREPRRPLRAILASPWLPRAVVPLVVLLTIAALVWPRGPAAPQEDPATAAPLDPPATLVRRALDQLYAPPSADERGVWHARYAMRWFFADASYADLQGTLWVDELHGRHRVQLVHEEGGGPFEIQLADGDERVWYAAEPRYAASIYPQIAERFTQRVELELPAAQQQAMLQARLVSGAWWLPAAYLRQAAEAAELRSWGRRTAEDGADLAVISFRGLSALGPPAGAPGLGSDVTVLLAIDTASGALYEVRELVGSDAAEQTGRTVWRYLGGERLLPSQAAEEIFDPRQALRSRGSFAVLPQGVASPDLPLVPVDATLPLARTLDRRLVQPLAPADAPPGITSAALIAAEGGGRTGPTLMYLGDGRRMAIRTLELQQGATPFPRTAETEEVQLGPATALLRPGPAQRYEALFGEVPDGLGTPFYARVSAQGFSRDELLGVLSSLAPLSVEAVRRQSSLFVGAAPADPAAAGALLDALAEAPPPMGLVRHTVARVFARQAPAGDALGDPYHRPLYGGRPETLVQETWTRATEGGVETASLTRGADGTVYERSYAGPRGAWSQDVPRGEVLVFTDGRRSRLPNQGEFAAERLLVCNGALVDTRGGERAVALTEPEWPSGSCAQPSYPGLAELQRTLALQRSDGGVVYAFASPDGEDTAPFVADLAGAALTFLVTLGPNGRVARAEVSALGEGTTSATTAVERWELVSEDVAPADRVAPEVFRTEPPPALTRMLVDGGAGAPNDLVAVTPAQAQSLLDAPVYEFANEREDGAPFDVQAYLKDTLASTFDPDGIYGGFQLFSDPFESALHHGAALRFEFALAGETGGGIRVYQGRAARFGGYLRARARWLASEPTTALVDGREVPGWLVMTFDGRRWALAEVGDTLLALPAEGEAQLDLLLRLVATPS